MRPFHKTLLKKWQKRQNEIDQYFMYDENHGGIERCPLVSNYVLQKADPNYMVFDGEFTWARTGERVRMTVAQKEQGSPHFIVKKVKEIAK